MSNLPNHERRLELLSATALGRTAVEAELLTGLTRFFADVPCAGEENTGPAEFFNPHHDQYGRFTPGDGAATLPTDSGKQKPPAKKSPIIQRAIEALRKRSQELEAMQRSGKQLTKEEKLWVKTAKMPHESLEFALRNFPELIYGDQVPAGLVPSKDQAQPRERERKDLKWWSE